MRDFAKSSELDETPRRDLAAGTQVSRSRKRTHGGLCECFDAPALWKRSLCRRPLDAQPYGRPLQVFAAAVVACGGARGLERVGMSGETPDSRDVGSVLSRSLTNVRRRPVA